MSEERVEYYGITDPPGVTISDEMKPYMLELLRLQKEVQKYQWISVKQKFPEQEGQYLTVSKHKKTGSKWIDINYYDPDYGFDINGTFESWQDIYVTHWMELPILPVESKVETNA